MHYNIALIPKESNKLC